MSTAPAPFPKGVFRGFLPSISSIVKTIYQYQWDNIDCAKMLRAAISDTFSYIHNSAIAYVDLEHNTCLTCKSSVDYALAVPNIHADSIAPESERTKKQIAESHIALAIIHAIRTNGQAIQIGSVNVYLASNFSLNVEHCDVFIVYSSGIKRVSSAGVHEVSDGPIACLLYHWNGIAKLFNCNVDTAKNSLEVLFDHLAKSVANPVLPLILDAFRDYERRLAAFPGKLRERYWQDVLTLNAGGELGKKALRPPWEHCHFKLRDVETVTLSLDLRKSTYCMEYAESNRRFGRWLEMLTEKMRSVAHLHGGIYDKFTGDGSLVHFLGKECREIYDMSPVEAAVHCAVDMQRAIELHMIDLRTFLRHDSPQFGAGIAIDVGDAFWACDDRDNPVVVGRGVVGACRVGDKAPRHTVRLTNHVYNRLDPRTQSRLVEMKVVDLDFKDVPDSLTLQCRQFDAGKSHELGKGDAVMKELCDKVKRRFPDDLAG